MSDDTPPEASGSADDTTGHVLHGEAAEHPVSGGRAPDLARAVTGEDDTQGHAVDRRA